MKIKIRENGRERTLLAVVQYKLETLNRVAIDDAESLGSESAVLWRTAHSAGIAIRTRNPPHELYNVIIGDGRRGIRDLCVFEIGPGWCMPGQTLNQAWLQRHLGTPNPLD